MFIYCHADYAEKQIIKELSFLCLLRCRWIKGELSQAIATTDYAERGYS